MKAITKEAKAILARIIAGLHEPGDAKKLDNAPGTYMPLCVEQLAFSPAMYSLAHYGEQNGDAMRDPDVVFYCDGEEFYPCSYRNDYAGVDAEYVEFVGGEPARYAKRQQADLADFCETWLANLVEQQGV